MITVPFFVYSTTVFSFIRFILLSGKFTGKDLVSVGIAGVLHAFRRGSAGDVSQRLHEMKVLRGRKSRRAGSKDVVFSFSSFSS